MNWRTNQNVVHPGNEILLYEMKEERHKRDVKRYNPNKEDYTLFYIIYIKCLESRNRKRENRLAIFWSCRQRCKNT